MFLQKTSPILRPSYFSSSLQNYQYSQINSFSHSFIPQKFLSIAPQVRTIFLLTMICRGPKMAEGSMEPRRESTGRVPNTDSTFQQSQACANQDFMQFISKLIHNNMSQYNVIIPSIALEKQQNSGNSSQPAKNSEPGPMQPTLDVSADQAQKNRRWNERQHILYILFLEENREKIKSKLIRRSNSFFKEMAAFIDSKSSTQCRSYHQKYQTKYKFPHRIIREEREKLDQGLYKEIVEEFGEKCRKQAEMGQNRCKGHHGGKVKREAVETAEYECQTTIQGVSTIFIQQDQPVKQICQEEPNPFPYSLLNYPFLNYCYPQPFYLH